MGQLEQRLACHRLLDGSVHHRLIFGKDVVLRPVLQRLHGIGPHIVAVELVHVAPVRAHAVGGVIARHTERTEAAFLLAQSFFGLFALRDLDKGDDRAFDPVLGAAIRPNAGHVPAALVVHDLLLDRDEAIEHGLGIAAQVLVAEPVRQVRDGAAAIRYADVEDLRQAWGKAQDAQLAIQKQGRDIRCGEQVVQIA